MTPATSTVLVLSAQPLVAALLGMLLELLGYRPAFAERDERPEDALRRVRPVAVVLLDQEMDAAVSDVFFAQAARHKVGLAVFGLRAHADRLAVLARERGVPWFDVPLDLPELARAIKLAATSEWWRRRSERRALARTERDDDGVLIFIDPRGRRWSVYDRRRHLERRGSDGVVLHRVFVNEAGETWEYPLADGETGKGDPATAAGDADSPSPEELQRQLERAVRT